MGPAQLSWTLMCRAHDSPAKVRRLVATGRLQAVARGRQLLFGPDDVVTFIEPSRIVPGRMAWAWQMRERSLRHPNTNKQM